MSRGKPLNLERTIELEEAIDRAKDIVLSYIEDEWGDDIEIDQRLERKVEELATIIVHKLAAADEDEDGFEDGFGEDVELFEDMDDFADEE